MKPTLLALTALVLLTACRPDPEDLFFIIGEVVDPDAGAPVAGVNISLARNKSEYCNPFGATRETPYVPRNVGSLTGTGYTPLAETTTDSQGRYLFELMRFQVSAVDGYPYCLRATMQTGPSGSTSELYTFASLADLLPPPMLRWTPALHLDHSQIALPTLPVEPSPPLDPAARPAAEGRSLHAYEWEILADEGTPAWREEASGPFNAAPEIREDFGGAATLQLLTSTTRTTGALFQGYEYFFSHQRSAPRDLPAGLVPVSRGAPCSADEEPLVPCTLTDGALSLKRFYVVPEDPFEEPQSTAELRFDLGSPKSLRHAVVRDLFVSGSALVISGSNDQEEWTELGRGALPSHGDSYPVYQMIAGGGRYLMIGLDPDAGAFQHIRFTVRTESESPGTFDGVRELSLFE